MKLSKKLMLFEEFSEVNTKVEVKQEVSTTDRRANVDNDIRTEISHDVDSIISKLEDLARGIKQEETNESSNLITESAAEKMLSSELYMIPLIAVGIVAGAGVGVGVLLKRALTKKKIKSQFKKNVHVPKLQAAKMEVAIDSLKEAIQEETATKDPKQAKITKKVDAYKKKIEDLKKSAEEFSKALGQKYSKYSDFIAVLNSEANMEIAKMMLSSKGLSDSEKEKYQQMYKNAEESDKKAAEKAEAELKAAEEKAKNASEEQKKKLEEERKKQEEALAKRKEEDTERRSKEESDREVKNSKEGMLKRIDDMIKKAEESGDEEKLKKAKELRDKVSAKESWNLYDFDSMILENKISTLELELV
jgi:uncharacterized protein YneF (UPF0154 family)